MINAVGLPLIASLANVTMGPLKFPLEINLFVPLIIKRSPSLTAVVVICFGSEPVPGSVKANDANISPLQHGYRYFSFWASVPKLTIAPKPRVLTEMTVSYTHLRAHETDSYLVC